MKKIIFFLLAALPFTGIAQPGGEEPKADTSWKKIYRATTEKVNDLVHTKLDVRFDYDKAWMYGKEWLTVKPHFYPTNNLTLDAKGMEIKEVAIMKGANKSPLKYSYDGEALSITLDKTYKGGENYTVYIDYTSKPNEVKAKGSAAITDAKGLYFINPQGEDKDKPTQIWTQGETEANSVWMPTIDKPNQKTTDEIYMTVPAKYVTLSNGLLISQKKNADGTRTDYWKMDLPHSPYLFFMGVGDYKIIKDSYKGKEVSYYVEPDQAQYAKGVFGLTPEMIKFYSEKLGVDFPWQKYSQIVGRDYVSGAMENTTATLHQESAYQNNRELADGNGWESTIAHELFHQWFGDLVTCESWSNITVNESFANYSETLWFEYKHGKDAGDEHHNNDMAGYLRSNSEKKDLVRFYYKDKEDVFDAVSYNKGGRVLHMLRNYVGDDAFFKSLNNYLTTNKFKNGEGHQLRLAFEETTGKDLSWYWNQWYYGSGHPIVKIDYKYDDAAGKATVIIEQTQKTGKVFKLPLAIDVYNGAAKKRYNVWVENKVDSFTFDYSQKPDLINVDGDKVMLWVKTDNKTADNFMAQYKNAGLYLDRKEALDYFAKKGLKELAWGLTDKYAPLRRSTLEKLATVAKFVSDADIVKAVEGVAANEKDKRTKAAAIDFLAKTKDAKYLSLFKQNTNDISYTVAGAALNGVNVLEPKTAYELAKKLDSDAKGDLGDAVNSAIMDNGTEADFDMIANRFDKLPFGQAKFQSLGSFADYLTKVNSIDNVKKGIDMILSFRKAIPEQFSSFTEPTFKSNFEKIGKAKGKEIADYIAEKMK